MGVWQGVAMDSLKFHPGPPYPTLLRPAHPEVARLPASTPWTPHAVRLWVKEIVLEVLVEPEIP
jgi:hypothetical protein